MRGIVMSKKATNNEEKTSHKEEITKEQEEITLLKTQIEDLTSTLKRVQADYQNYQKRVERDREEQAKYAAAHIIKQFLPLLDNLELALKHCNKKDDFYKGIEMIYKHLHEMLHDEGVTTIKAQGQAFDPYKHEALMTVASNKEPNTVIDVMQQGYQLHDKILRPAKVSISKKQEKSSKGGEKHE
jgi:molecular chaperone GrpE